MKVFVLLAALAMAIIAVKADANLILMPTSITTAIFGGVNSNIGLSSGHNAFLVSGSNNFVQ
jgi:hypothetical protein